MKSNICVLSNNKECLNDILSETEKVLVYNNLEKQNALRLRLLAEEMVGLVSELINNFDGEFYLENKGNKYRLCASLDVSYMDKNLKQKLIDLSSNKKNKFSKGIKGKILSAFENIALSISENGVCVPGSIVYNPYEDYTDGVTYAWRLNDYKEEVKADVQAKANEWDELEKSIIAKLADDVLVGVRTEKVEIMIIKKFD